MDHVSLSPSPPLSPSTEVVDVDQSQWTEVVIVDDALSDGCVNPVLGKESSFDEDALNSWWPEGQLTVCFVHWAHTNVDNPQDFYEILRSALPSGTHFFGCKRDDHLGENDYLVMLGFPYRIGYWKGLKDRLSLKDGDRPIDAEKVFFYFVDPVVETPGDCVKFWSAVCVVKSSASGRFTSSSRAFELAPYLSSADDMWKISEQDKNGVE